MRKVKAEISMDGKVSLEFIGFTGEECSEERERLRNVLLDLGVMLEPEKLTKKSAEQIALETGVTERKKMKLNLDKGE